MRAQDLLPFGLSPEGAITAMAAVAGFAVVCAIWQALLAHDPMAVEKRAMEQQTAR